MFSKDLPLSGRRFGWHRNNLLPYSRNRPSCKKYAALDAALPFLTLVSPDCRPDDHALAAQGTGYGGIHGAFFPGVFCGAAGTAVPCDDDAANLAGYGHPHHVPSLSVLCLTLGLCLPARRVHDGCPLHAALRLVDGIDVPALPGAVLVLPHGRA